MRIFLDTANLEEIKTAVSWGVIDGVTTNPTLCAKEGKTFKQLITEILEIVDGDVSVEVLSTSADEIIAEAAAISEWNSFVVVKIPITAEGLKAVSKLREKGIRTNVTLVFSVNQALLAANAGATYVSIFVGRLDDIGHDGMQVVRDILTSLDFYAYKTQLIVASIRHPLHVIEAFKAGVDVVTIPFSVLEKMVHHPLTDAGIQKFSDDWKKVTT